jgi:hypothetical protein
MQEQHGKNKAAAVKIASASYLFTDAIGLGNRSFSQPEDVRLESCQLGPQWTGAKAQSQSLATCDDPGKRQTTLVAHYTPWVEPTNDREDALNKPPFTAYPGSRSWLAKTVEQYQGESDSHSIDRTDITVSILYCFPGVYRNECAYPREKGW